MSTTKRLLSVTLAIAMIILSAFSAFAEDTTKVVEPLSGTVAAGEVTVELADTEVTEVTVPVTITFTNSTQVSPHGQFDISATGATLKSAAFKTSDNSNFTPDKTVPDGAGLVDKSIYVNTANGRVVVESDVIEGMQPSVSYVTVDVVLKFDTALTAGQVIDVVISNIAATNLSEASWDGMKAVNGTIVVEEAVVEPVYDANLKTGGFNGSFAAAYSVLYYVKKDVYESYDEFSIDVEKENFVKENGVYVSSDPIIVTLTTDDLRKDANGDPQLYYNSSNSTYYYQFELKGIAAKEVANSIVATPKAVKDGVSYYGVQRKANLVTYASYVITSGSDENEKVAMIAFLNYAAAAQKFFGYNADNLANASLTDEQKTVTLTKDLQNDATKETDWAGELSIGGFNVSYESQIQMVAYLTPYDYDLTNAKLRCSYYKELTGETIVDYVDLTEITETFYNSANSKTYLTVRYSGIAAKDMRSVVTMYVVDAEGNKISNERTFSFTSYAYNYRNDSSEGPLTKAMMVFSDAIAVYLNNK